MDWPRIYFFICSVLYFISAIITYCSVPGIIGIILSCILGFFGGNFLLISIGGTGHEKEKSVSG